MIAEKYITKITIDTNEDFFIRIGEYNNPISSLGSFSIIASTEDEARDNAVMAIKEAKITWTNQWIRKDGIDYSPAWEEIKFYILKSIQENPNDLYWSVGSSYAITVSIHKKVNSFFRCTKVYWYLIDKNGFAEPFADKESAENAIAIRTEQKYENSPYRVAAMVEVES